MRHSSIVPRHLALSLISLVVLTLFAVAQDQEPPA